MGALQRACGHASRDKTKEVFEELNDLSVVSEIQDGHLVSVHNLMHKFLKEKREKMEVVVDAGDGDESSKSVVSSESDPEEGTRNGRSRALAYFAAFHHVRSDDPRWDALKTATEKYGAELADEEEIVMAALRQNGSGLQFVGEMLRGEDKVVRAAMTQFGPGQFPARRLWRFSWRRMRFASRGF